MGVSGHAVRSTQARGAAFEAFVREAEPRLRIALAAALGQQRGADATAEALAYGWEHWDRVAVMDNPCGYLYRVGRSRAPVSRELRLPPVPVSVASRIEPGLPAVLATLSERQRVAGVLIHGYEWTPREVADLLDLEVPTVATHLRRGLAKLREGLKVNDDG
jgi:DNA-directed RNA polymerase specialized sigma24 family protein